MWYASIRRRSMKGRKCYELRINGVLAARGDINFMARQLGLSVSTAQRIPYRGHAPKGFEMVSLPNVYDFQGGTYTLEELSSMIGASKGSIVTAASRGQGVNGHRVVKHTYEEYTVGTAEIERMRLEAKRKG